MTTNPKTRIGFLLDESSSMEIHKTITLSALGEYVKTLQEGDDDIDFSLVVFSNVRTKTIVKSTPIKAVDIDAIVTEYAPRGSTPLIEAAIKTIKGMETVIQPAEKAVIVLQTDGEENCSSPEYKLADLQAAIKEKSDLGWQFVFLGAGLDAYQAAASYGIGAGQTVSHGVSGQSVNSTYRSLAQNTKAFASGQAATMDWSEQQKDAAGDIYAEQHPCAAPPPAPPVEPNKPKPMVDDISL